MGATLAKIYVVLSGAILVVVGIAGFFRHEMFNLTFPPAHNIFHLGSGVIGLWAGLGKRAGGVRRFGLSFGGIYTLLAIAGFAGLRDLGPVQLDLNSHFNVIHLGVGLLSLAAGLLGVSGNPRTYNGVYPPGVVVSTIDDNFPTFRFLYRKLTGRAGKLVFLLVLAFPLGIWGALRLSMLRAVRRSETLLTRIKNLRVRESTFLDAKHLADQYSGHVDYHNSTCETAKCDYGIFLLYGWIDQSDRMHEVLRSVGIRQFSVSGSVKVIKGRVMSTEFGVWAEARKGAPGGQWLVLEAHDTDRIPRDDYSYGRLHGLEEHPNRDVGKPHLTTGGGGQIIRSTVTPDATARELERAFDFRLSCLSSLKGCAQLSDLLPSAWEDLLAERKMQSRTTPENSEQSCSVRTLARLSRDMENVLLVEVKQVFSSQGKWDGTQDVKFQLVEILKGKTSPHLERYPMQLVKGSPIADRRSPRLAPEIFSSEKRIVLFLRESELDFIPNPYCEVVPASSENLTVIRQSTTQLEQGLPITALK